MCYNSGARGLTACLIQRRKRHVPDRRFGNPGAQYAHTRHNVGFDVVDTLARKLGVTIGRERDEALLGECFIAGQKTILALPQTYMNLSGEAVSRLVRWYRLPPENLMVVYDDVDLPQGAIRIRKNGSAGHA